jgi:uncharacterized protein YndB with AHSA1/START domain
MFERFEVSTPADVPEISASRLFDAPRDLVFDAFSSPSRLAHWWGPTGFTLTTQEMIFAPGGVWRFVMHSPDGRDYKNKIVFQEIDRPERIRYAHPGDEGTEPVQMQVTVSFAQEGDKTRLDWRSRFPTIAERDRVEREYGAAKGLAETLARLEAYVARSGERAFVISRDFDASLASLWEALTDAERMAKWWGPKGCSVASAQMDFRRGGQYLYGLKTPDGGVMWGRFAYREIDQASRIVSINSFSDENGGVIRHPMSAVWPLELLSIFSLEAEGERTRLTVRAQPINATDAEVAAFFSEADGMSQGWGGTFEQLANYLAGETAA